MVDASTPVSEDERDLSVVEAHSLEARRQIAALARLRGSPVPPIPEITLRDIENELTPLRTQIAELEKERSESVPRLSIRGPWSISIGSTGIGGGRLVVIILALAVLVVAIAGVIVAVRSEPMARPGHSIVIPVPVPTQPGAN